ncbi:hypothetical protein GS501_04670 [Saccharibacter sp. 17.LH.SD]|uniref:hypothetical protein n=1 Tax=Saccharibacter sp. 17.LH.SD TaxID=2689393 RepID=UPI00137137D7|nr:hypothetical protein [Saccharibacter sp. 17.LH.SD]MXV44339.1 hypothetical protein [Saccharibacter sp. 17.LH.SD]
MFDEDDYEIDPEPAIDLEENYKYFYHTVYRSQEDRRQSLGHKWARTQTLLPSCHPCFQLTTPQYKDIPDDFLDEIVIYPRTLRRLGEKTAVLHYKYRDILEEFEKECTDDDRYTDDIIIIDELPHPGDNRVMVPVIKLIL